MAVLLDGKKVSAEVKSEVASEVKLLNEKGITVYLAVVIVGEDPASKIYVRNKKRACEECGIKSLEYTLPETTSEKELLELIEKLNCDKEVNGILVQMPLPKHISEKAVIDAISPLKDVDAFTDANVGKIMIGSYNFLPCTPAGVMELLKSENIDIEGKNCVVIGRSNIVGKPMSMLLLHKNATVTICHSRTKDIASITKNADLIVAAVGRKHFLTADMVKDGAIIVDVGINRDENGKVCGDVDFMNVKEKASYITPVPGGVGPMTIAVLMKNTLKAANLQYSTEE